MPGPVVTHCGGLNEPVCPPDNAAVINGVKYYTLDQMYAHGHANYQKGIADTLAKVNAVLDDPSHGWGDGELARAIKAAMGQ